MKQKELQIQLTLEKDNKQLLCYKNYIISIKLLTFPESSINLSNNNLELDFYDNKTFKRVLTLKSERKEFPIEVKENKISENINKINYGNFKLFNSNHKLYLFGYTEHTFNCVLSKSSALGIFELNINEKKLEKKISFFDYVNFIDNEKDNKIYFLLNEGIMIYELSTNNKVKIKFNYPGAYKKLILVDDYILILSMDIFLSKYNHKLYASIFDKNLRPLRINDNNTIILSNYFEYNYNTKDYFTPVSENLFLLETDNNNINIGEFRIKGKEKLLRSCKEIKVEYEEIEFEEYEFNSNYEEGKTKLLNVNINEGDEELIDYIYKQHKLSIKEEEKLNSYPYFNFSVLNNDLLGIVGKNVYIYNISSLTPIIKLELPFNAFEQKLSIIKYREENDKYKLYLGNNKRMILLSYS